MFSGKVIVQTESGQQNYPFDCPAKLEAFLATNVLPIIKVERNTYGANQPVIQGNTGTITINY